jgi:hypothetical protein
MNRGKYIRTQEHKNKMSLLNKGRKPSQKTLEKMSLSHKGINTWTKGRKQTDEAKKLMCLARIGRKPMLGKKHSEKAKLKMSQSRQNISQETRKKISKKLKGRIISFQTRLKLSNINKGRHPTRETLIKMSENRKGKRIGDKHPNWKGGITPIMILIRNSIRCKEWRQSVFIRDNFTCQECGDKTGGNLEAHHIKKFSILIQEAIKYMPLLEPYEACLLYTPLWDITNGKTLCIKCHTKYRKIK